MAIYIMDFPEYKEKYPDKTMDDWLAYRQPLSVKKTLDEFEKLKSEIEQLPNEEKAEIKQMIDQFIKMCFLKLFI